MKNLISILILSTILLGQKPDAFNVDVRPRIIDNNRLLINVEVINHVGRPVDYLEGFLSEYNNVGEFIGESRMVLVYSYEPPLQTGFSTTKSTTYSMKTDIPNSYKFHISKVKFSGENRVYAWHPKSGFIRID